MTLNTIIELALDTEEQQLFPKTEILSILGNRCLNSQDNMNSY